MPDDLKSDATQCVTEGNLQLNVQFIDYEYTTCQLILTYTNTFYKRLNVQISDQEYCQMIKQLNIVFYTTIFNQWLNVQFSEINSTY